MSIETKSLEAHVELEAQRYKFLTTKVSDLETKMDGFGNDLTDIKNLITGHKEKALSTVLKVSGSVIGALVLAIATILWYFIVLHH